MQNIQWISEHLSVKPYTPKVIACYILLSIAIDKQLFFCDFDFYRFPISIDNKRLIISIVSDPRFDTHQRIGFSLAPLPSNRDHFVRLEWDQLSSDEFAVVIWRYTDQKFPKFWDHGSQKMCTNRDYFILHWDFSRKIFPIHYLYRFIRLDIMADAPYSSLTPSGPLSKIWQKKWSGRDQTGYDRVLVKIIQAASNFRPINDDHS